MKLSRIKQMGQRMLALALVLVLAAQAAPLTGLAASADWDAAAAEQSAESAQAAVPVETENTEPTEEVSAESEDAELQSAEPLEEKTAAEQETVEDSVADPVQSEEATETVAAELDVYALLATAAEGTVEVTSADQLLKGVPAGSVYVLANDITMGADQQIGVVAGILNGNGHTITISGKALINEVTGTVQNLKVAGKASLANGQGSIACKLNGGSILNSCSTAVIDMGWSDGAGGLVGTAENGRIYNSFFAGSGRDMFGLVAVNGIVGQATNEAAPVEIKNCYYAEGTYLCAGSGWNRDNTSNGKKTPDEMKKPEFVQLLNTNIQDTGYNWAAAESDLPMLTVKSSENKPSENIQITTAEELPAEIPEGVTYELAADITLKAEQQIALVAGTLEGNGYTITISGKALINEVTGTVQNLKVAGKASLANGQGSIACKLNGGSILNSCSTAVIDMGWSDGAGGLVGTAEDGRIYNSFFAGSGRDIIGLVAVNGIVGQATNEAAPVEIKNCYYTEGTYLCAGSGWNRDDPSNGKKTPDEMKKPEFVQLLNATKLGIGHIWTTVEGDFPALIEGGGELEPCDKTALEAAIKQAQSKNESDYTGATWAVMQDALNAAKKINEKIDATQDEANQAEKDLLNAIEALEEKVRDHSPVELPKEGVISISSKEDLARINGSESNRFYQLTKDIVLEGNYLSPNLAGVLDGNGHTITIRTASSIFHTITQTGVVQNLRVKVEGNFTNRVEFAPYAQKLQGGMIVNCSSEITGQHSAGYVRKMEDGVMANCLTMGHNRRGAFVFFQKSTDHRNDNGYKTGKFYNCYWSASNSVENITPAENLINCAPVGDEELRSESFIAKLNSEKGKFGVSWGRDENGYPYFGKDQGDCVIDGSKNRYDVKFKWHDNRVTNIENGELRLSPQVTSRGRFAGTFQLENVPKDSTITWTCEDRTNQEIMQLNEKGELYVFHDGGGVVRAMEHKADGTQELAAEIRVVSASREIAELRLVFRGEVVKDTITVQGSAVEKLSVEAKYADSDEFAPLPDYLVDLKAEKTDLLLTDYNTGAFHFRSPGTSKLTVTEKNPNKTNPASVTVTVTSEYVPVKSIKPDISGTVDIHYRNSMGSGQFISLPQTVQVDPSNASYKENIRVESSDPSIAQYDGSGYTPYKSGTVTFTAKLEQDGKTLEGKSKVTFVYANPLAEVVGPEAGITIEQGARQELPLIFRGQPGNKHKITEPNLIWTFDNQGIVSIQRPNTLEQVRESGGPDDGNWVASAKFEVRGLRAGTVIATGTPVDTSGGAKPVKITITVKGNGNPVPEFDIPQFIKDGKKAASSYLNAHMTFGFGEEWGIYALLRDGQTVPQQKLDSYYSDVVTNVRSWKSDVLATEVERTALALNIMGKDITNVGGVNLVERICDHQDLTKQGSNALAWALIALDMNNTQIPADMKWSRESMIAELLKYQNKDGGFGLDKTGVSGVDMTAMCIQALARYRKQDEVAAAIEKGMKYLEAETAKNLNLGNSESISQVIITLAVLNRDIVAEPGFGDELENVMSALAEYMVAGEGFKHDKNGKVDKMASVQAMQALCAYERYLNGESGYWDLKGSGLADSPAEKVSNMIAALPEKITLADAYAVKQCREAYNRLTAAQQIEVTNVQKLEAAEAALKKLANVDSVKKMIDALPENVTLADQNAVLTARAAFDLLTADQKAQVGNKDKLFKAEKSIADQKAAAKVEKLIQALPENVTLADKKAVHEARSAYEALSAQQKTLVKNLDKLTRAEEKLKDLDAAQKVMGMIKDLPVNITVADEQAVKNARSAYQALTESQKKLVLNLYILEKAERTLAEKQAVQKVEDAINALPETVTIEDADAIEAARAAYNHLSPELRKQVGNLDKLLKAERALRELRRPMGKPGKFSEESNVVKAVVKNGVVSAKQLEDIQGEDLILRIEGIMDSGEKYVLSIHGKDVENVKDFHVGINRKGRYEKEIHKLSKNPEIFRFLETGTFPGAVMVQMDTSLEDGEYLLLRYNPDEQRAALVTRVKAENGQVKFIVQEGGEYFLAKKASKKSIPELEEAEKLSAELKAEDQNEAAETVQTIEETQPVQQEEENNLIVWILLPCLILAAAGAAVTLKKRKENKGE